MKFILLSETNHLAKKAKFVVRISLILITVLLINNKASGQADTLLLNKQRLQLLPNQPIDINSLQHNQLINNELSLPGTTLPDTSGSATSNQLSVVKYDTKLNPIDSYAMKAVEQNIEAAQSYDDIRMIPEIHIVNRGNDKLVYQPAIISHKPLTYDKQAGGFKSTLNFVLVGEENAENLKNPVDIEFHSDRLQNIQPTNISIDHLNLPSTRVELTGSNIEDSVEVRLVTETNIEGYKTNLTIEPQLQLFTNRTELQGFGIQKVPIEVHWLGSNATDSAKVIINAKRGSIKPNNFYLPYDSSATVYLRSEGLGQSSISANTQNSNTVNLTFIFPWMFLGFSLAGGLVGGTAKYFIRTQSQKSFGKLVAGGICIGFISAVAYFALGINLLQVEVSTRLNEFAVLGISALTAYFGGSLSQFDKNKPN